MVVAMLWVAPSVTRPGFLISLRDPMMVAEEKAFNMHGVRCDVLVYGDSTAMTGVDPSIITAETGLTACNISVTWPVVSMLDTFPLDAYLAHNQRPKYLVLQFIPRAFYDRRTLDENMSTSGPIAMLLRHRGGWPTLLFLAHHSDDAVPFFWQAFLTSRRPKQDRSGEFHRIYDQRLQDFNANRSSLLLARPILTECSPAVQSVANPPDQSWLASLRKRYQRDGTTVLIKASPVPDCDLHVSDVQKQLAPVLDANVEALPMQDFDNGGRHMTAQGAADESHHLAQLIESRERSQGGATSH